METASLNPELLLARRAARADPRAWDELVERFGERIYNLCWRFAASPSEAEDLTQEVFLKLYRQLSRYRGEVPLIAWALRLSRNLCIDHYRHTRAARLAEVDDVATLEQAPAGGDLDERLETRERLRRVHRVLDEMPESLATVVLLRDLQGFSYDEIAGYLEVPVGTVKSRLNRGRQDLVERLAPWLDAAAPPAPATAPPLNQVPPC